MARTVVSRCTNRAWWLLFLLAVLTGCSYTVDDTAPFEIDGELDCLTDDSWSQQGQHDPALPGEPGTPSEVLQTFLAPYRETYDLEAFQLVGDSIGVLTTDGREVVIAFAIPVETGGLFVSTLQSCGPYRPLG